MITIFPKLDELWSLQVYFNYSSVKTCTNNKGRNTKTNQTNQTKTNQLKWAYQISVILFISVPDIPNSKPIDTSRYCCSATSAVWCLRPNLKKNFDRCQCFNVECFKLKLSFDMRSFHWHFLIKMPKQWRINCKTSAFARRRMR